MHPLVELSGECFADSVKEESPGDSCDALTNELEEFTAANGLYVLLSNRRSLSKLSHWHFIHLEDVFTSSWVNWPILV